MWCHDRALADDLTQEALTKAPLHADQLRDPTRLRPWLYGILVNCWRDHLRDGVSAHAGRISSLRVVYPGLTLVACGQTVQRLRDSGVEVKLLPGTITAASALDEIVLRLQQGWAYGQI